MSRVLVMVLMIGSMGFARASAAQEMEPPTCDRLPSNIRISDMFRPMVEALLQQSPTLQRQCLLIGATRHVRIVIEARIPKDTIARAWASIARHEAGFLNAHIVLPVGSEMPELLAHELEHVIEQIEGVDLAALARRDSSAARRHSEGTYETTRAMRAGLAAAGEIEIRQTQHAVAARQARAATALKAAALKPIVR